ncbi:MAG: hypothetical protein H8D78_20150, partial [Chloroflexi bacterium]|nr:hypothetical protein [Chloroflexota bacterium]
MTNQSIVPQKNIDVGTIHPASEDPTAPTKATLSLGHLSPAVGREYACTILAAGELEGHGKFLPAAVLEKAAHLFTNLTAFVDHPSWLERQKIDRMAGVFKDAHYSDDRIKATLALWPTPAADWLATLLDHLIQAQDDDEPAANIGISAELWWQVDWDHVRSDGLYNITQIVDVEAAVVTFNPGSDAARFEKILAQAGILPPHITQEVKEMSDKLTKPPEVTAAGPPPQPQTFDPAPHMRALTEAVLTAQLAASPLPQAMKETVRLQFTGQVANPDEISAAIGRQTALLAKLQEDSVISGFGTPRQGGSFIHGMANDLDRLQAAVDAMVAGVRPKDARPLTGVRELYHILSGDYAMTGVFQGEHVQLANANTSTMAGMVANAMNKVIVNLWQQYPKFWEKAVTVRDFSNLNDARWITLGGIGELPTVAEGGTYGELSWDDLTETDAFVKKGGYLGLTMEAIDKDDTSKLMAAPQALTQAAWLTLGKAVSAIFTTASGTGPTMSDSVVLFHAVTHGNLLTTALSPAEIEVVDIAMKKQTEL